MKNKDFKIQDTVSGQKKSKLNRYQELVIGSTKFSDLLKYELITLLTSWVPGAFGVFLRTKLYPSLLGKCGSGVVFGSGVILRHPHKIKMGNNVIIDDNVLIDAKGVDNEGITLKDDVFIGRNSILSCKGGNIELCERANLGFNCYIFSSNNVKLGKDTLVAAYSYFVGGGNYKLDRKDIPINQQYDFNGKGGVETKEDVWIGAHCMILDGVKIGKGSVLAAGAVATKSLPEYSICAGIPAKVLKTRD